MIKCFVGSFYENGLCFQCKRCSNCCRHSGYVFLSEKDITQLATALAVTPSVFTQKYCKTVAANGQIRISLDEKQNGDCIFYGDLQTKQDESLKDIKQLTLQEGKVLENTHACGCQVYRHRPLQCKLYPFWHQLVTDQSKWQAQKSTCPGIDCGKRYSATEIEQRLAQRLEDPIIK